MKFKSIALNILSFTLGSVLTLFAIFCLMAFDRAIPASQDFQKSCPTFSSYQIKTNFIKSWLRMAGKDEMLDEIGFSTLEFKTSPVYYDNSWSGELKVVGSKASYSANVILDCYNGHYDYTGPFELK